ncbi:MAG: ABC transporter substrate-binding protein [Nitrospiraceae bacterium]|nr:ABC transporter substrate-binding protein [Nitrospiraceae bacterium]
MKRTSDSLRALCLTIPAAWFCLLLVLLCGPYASAAETKPSRSPEEMLRLGERMYREGILPSGEKMQAFLSGDVPVSGEFACGSCHLRSGVGSNEGGVFTPPTNGYNLYRPVEVMHKGVAVASSTPVRPAYTDGTLAAVIRTGVDPAGRTLRQIMPRYVIDDDAMSVLIYYLKALSSEFSPGVSDDAISFAVVISDDLSATDRDALLVPLERFVAYKNNQALYYRSRAGNRSARMAETMLLSKDIAYRRILLKRWVLKGPSETWRGQLEEYNRTEPVFALLGGMVSGEWEPVHRFSEEHHIPCLFPITDFPVISGKDWYTLYFSKGLYLEGEAAARYLGSRDGQLPSGPVVQIVRDSLKGKALSEGFGEAWRGTGHRPPVTIRLKEGEPFTGEQMQRILKKETPSAVVLWDGGGALPAVAALAESGKSPAMLIVSSGYLGKDLWKLSGPARDFTYITYPYRLPEDEARYGGIAGAFLGMKGGTGDALVALEKTYLAAQVLSQALVNMNGYYYRDNLLDAIDMNMGMVVMGVVQEQSLPLYARFSFGPGQRYASKGCYIVQLSKGAGEGMIKRSDWVIH